ncbi:MAG: hypothetical protein ACRC4M_02660 [Mycoplasma sp.]
MNKKNKQTPNPNKDNYEIHINKKEGEIFLNVNYFDYLKTHIYDFDNYTPTKKYIISDEGNQFCGETDDWRTFITELLSSNGCVDPTEYNTPEELRTACLEYAESCYTITDMKTGLIWYNEEYQWQQFWIWVSYESYEKDYKKTNPLPKNPKLYVKKSQNNL